MSKLRALLVLLLSLSLPWSAAASLLDHCQHEGLGRTAAPAMHHEHGGGHHAAHGGCDCKLKCDCRHHCAGGAALSGVSLAGGMPSFDGKPGAVTVAYDGHLPAAWGGSPFRPPIAAPTGAA